jgi:hypothetical protein
MNTLIIILLWTIQGVSIPLWVKIVGTILLSLRIIISFTADILKIRKGE